MFDFWKISAKIKEQIEHSQGGGDAMKAVKVRVPDRHFEKLCDLVFEGVFPSISAAVRQATGNLLAEERRFGHL